MLITNIFFDDFFLSSWQRNYQESLSRNWKMVKTKSPANMLNLVHRNIHVCATKNNENVALYMCVGFDDSWLRDIVKFILKKLIFDADAGLNMKSGLFLLDSGWKSLMTSQITYSERIF